MLDLEQGAFPAQAARVAGERVVPSDHPMTRDHDAQRVAAYRRPDVPRIRPGPETLCETAVGDRLPVGHLGDQVPHAPVEPGALDLHSQIEDAAVSGEVLTDLPRYVAEALSGARAESRPVGPGPVPREIQPGQGAFLRHYRQLSQARHEYRVRGTRGQADYCRHCLLLPSLSRRAAMAEREWRRVISPRGVRLDVSSRSRDRAGW